MNNLSFDVIIIGGGSAGLSAALSASKQGAKCVIFELEDMLGGVLNQCIHNGFGLHYFKEELTGPEYADRLIKEVNKDENISVYLNSTVVSINPDISVSVVSKEHGDIYCKAKSIVFAVGCRERVPAEIGLIGSRPQGVFMAGEAQKLINLLGCKVGKKIVILGSGDIGLIMARRMHYEGAKVIGVYEIMSYSSGLKRNIVQCLDDYNIPLHYDMTVTRVVGKHKLEGVYIAPVDSDRKAVYEDEKVIECDGLLLSVGLIPLSELITSYVDIDQKTKSAIVNEKRQTKTKWLFVCGNVLHVNDLVDNVSLEGDIAGESAAQFALLEGEDKVDNITPTFSSQIRYVIPQVINLENDNKTVDIYFRVKDIYKNKQLVVMSNNSIIKKAKKLIWVPGEMEKITIDKKLIKKDLNLVLE